MIREDLQKKYDLSKEEVESEILELGLDPEVSEFSQEDSEKILNYFAEKYWDYPQLKPEVLQEGVEYLSTHSVDGIFEEVTETALERKKVYAEEISSWVEVEIDAKVQEGFESGKVIEIFDKKAAAKARAPKKPLKLRAQLRQQVENRLLSGGSYQQSLPSSEDLSNT